MITGHIIRQRLNLCDSHVVADTIDYLEAKFIFRTDDWDGLDKWVHFAKDSAVYDIRLTDNCIRKEDHLNLSAGMWKVYLHGNEFRDGEVVQRITTDEVVMYVIPTGTLDGEPFPTVPPSAGEQIIASAQLAEAGAKVAEDEAKRAKEAAAELADTAETLAKNAVKAAEDAGKAKSEAENAAEEARQAADEAAAYEPEVFIAEYGVTTFAEVEAAYEAGKLCVCRNAALWGFANLIGASAVTFEFVMVDQSCKQIRMRVKSSGEWVTTIADLLADYDVVTSVDETSADNKVPSAKAVYDAIQTYGGGGGSGTQVQTDWNQNDPTAVDYMKNRPFYEKYEYVVPETDIVFEMLEDWGLPGATLPFPANIENGQEIVVNFDGTDYPTSCLEVDEGVFVFGNSALYSPVDSGEPFTCVLFSTDDGYMAQLIVLNGAASATVSMRLVWVKTIDKKYLGTADQLESINLIDDSYTEGFPTITVGQKYELIPSAEIYNKINRSVVTKGVARFKMKITAEFPGLFSTNKNLEGLTDYETEVVMSVSGIVYDPRGDEYILSSFWRGYILYMRVMPDLIYFRMLKLTDIYYEL